MSFHTPRDLDEALRQAAAGARIVAGGTDLFPALGDGPPPDTLVDLSRLPGLSGITATRAGWRIGAATTWSALASAALPPALDALRQAAREVGSVQIQNTGTIGGNLCNASPAADGVPPLLALNATVTVAGAGGQRQMPLEDFLFGPRRSALNPGEILVAVEVPAPPEGAVSAFVKLGNRRYMVISVAMVAVVLWPDAQGCIGGAHVAVGSCSPVARRLKALEAALAGQRWDKIATLDLTDPALYAGIAPIDDTRGTAAYRSHAVPELCRRALAQATGLRHG